VIKAIQTVITIKGVNKQLIVDKVSMLDLDRVDTLYQIDQKLRYLRGLQDRDFGGMLPVVNVIMRKKNDIKYLKMQATVQACLMDR
jgi:hypothetical protein